MSDAAGRPASSQRVLRDLTQGSVSGHLAALAAPILVSMLIQALYFMVDLYFVSGLGKNAVAGVGAAGNLAMLVIALTQMLGVGTVSLVARAAGAKQFDRASQVFDQSLLVALACAAAVVLLGIVAGPAYMHAVGADAAVAAAGTTYLAWYLPGLALQFVLAAAGSALRGMGIVKPNMVAQFATLAMNVALAPVLVAGWGSGRPLGVAGAGLATTLSVAVGVVFLSTYLVTRRLAIVFPVRRLRPDWPLIAKMLRVGVPAGGEFMMMVVLNSAAYAVISSFGADAQAGFGIGTRVMQALLMPSMAISLALPAIAGHNVGAGHADRVRETLRQALFIEVCVMALVVAACQWHAEVPVRWFTQEPHASQVAVDFLHAISWSFFATGIVFACSGLLQGLGHTVPSLFSSSTRLVTFVLPAFVIARLPGFALSHVWWLSVASGVLQAAVSLMLVRRQLGRKT